MWSYLILLFVLVGCVEVKPTPVTVANKPAGVAWFLEPKYLEEQDLLKRHEALNKKRNELLYPWKNKSIEADNPYKQTNTDVSLEENKRKHEQDKCKKLVAVNWFKSKVYKDLVEFNSEWFYQASNDDLKIPINLLEKYKNDFEKQISNCGLVGNFSLFDDLKIIYEILYVQEVSCRLDKNCNGTRQPPITTKTAQAIRCSVCSILKLPYGGIVKTNNLDLKQCYRYDGEDERLKCIDQFNNNEAFLKQAEHDWEWKRRVMNMVYDKYPDAFVLKSYAFMKKHKDFKTLHSVSNSTCSRNDVIMFCRSFGRSNEVFNFQLLDIKILKTLEKLSIGTGFQGF